MTAEETSCSMRRMKEICSCFSPYASCCTTPPRPPSSPAGSTISPLTTRLPLHPQVLLVPPAPPLQSPNCPQSVFHLPWCCPPYLCWAGQPSTVPDTPLPFSPAWTEQSAGVALASPPVEGHQQWPSQAMSWRQLVSLSLPVCQVCLKLAELSRVDRWKDDDSWLWQHD